MPHPFAAALGGGSRGVFPVSEALPHRECRVWQKPFSQLAVDALGYLTRGEGLANRSSSNGRIDESRPLALVFGAAVVGYWPRGLSLGAVVAVEHVQDVQGHDGGAGNVPLKILGQFPCCCALVAPG